MKKVFLILTMLLVFASSMFAAAGEAQNLHVTFNSKTLIGQVARVVFTNKPLSIPDVTSNFKEYDNLATQDIVGELILKLETEGSIKYGSNSTSPLYVSYQMFTASPVNIIISQSGALESVDPVKQLHWKVFLEGHESDMVADTSDTTHNSFVASQIKPADFGVCGSSKLMIKTNGISVDDIGAYTARIIAIIEPVV